MSISLPSPTGISPTYDLLGQYSDDDEQGKTRSPVVESHEHHVIWKKVSETHDDLLAQRSKSKGDPGALLSTQLSVSFRHALTKSH